MLHHQVHPRASNHIYSLPLTIRVKYHHKPLHQKGGSPLLMLARQQQHLNGPLQCTLNPWNNRGENHPHMHH